MRSLVVLNCPREGRFNYAVVEKAGAGLAQPAWGDHEFLDVRIAQVGDSAWNVTQEFSTTVTNSWTRRQERRLEWGARHVVLLSQRDSLPGDKTREVNFDPPVKVLTFPLKAGPIPQPSSTGRTRNRRTVEIVEQMAVRDLGGREWPTWHIIQTDLGPMGGSWISEGWYSPDLGLDVKRVVRTAPGKFFGRGGSRVELVLESGNL